jgi:membrane-bound metal-dependent hydrolase YbcI (DUF457 family)
MLADADVLHGPTHTILGALVIGFLVMLIAPKICDFLLGRWNKEVSHHKLPWLVQGETTSKTAVAVGAFFGTLSHVALDSLMHHDIQPLMPFSQSNPLRDLVSHDGVYQLCAVAGVIGSILWLAMHWFNRPAKVEVVNLPPEPMSTTKSPSTWRLWVWELRSTWFLLFLLSIIPSFFFSSGLLPLAYLAITVVLVAPATARGHVFGIKAKAKELRQLAITLVVALLSVMYVLKSDDQITTNAAPIVAALESFRVENGQYPNTLEALPPKHLASVPKLNYLLVQQQITYGVADEKPYLRISAAAGAFAHFEYDFAAKVWNYYS